MTDGEVEGGQIESGSVFAAEGLRLRSVIWTAQMDEWFLHEQMVVSKSRLEKQSRVYVHS